MSANLVPLLLTGVRLHPPGRTDKNLCRCFGAPARRVFPDHLITCMRACPYLSGRYLLKVAGFGALRLTKSEPRGTAMVLPRVIMPRQLTQALTCTSKRLQIPHRSLGSLISSSPAAVLPRQTAQAQQPVPGPAGAAASWSIEDPDAWYRERRGHTVAVLRDSYPNFFADRTNFEIYTPDSLPLPVEPLLPVVASRIAVAS